jgi:hypothetical protein
MALHGAYNSATIFCGYFYETPYNMGDDWVIPVCNIYWYGIHWKIIGIYIVPVRYKQKFQVYYIPVGCGTTTGIVLKCPMLLMSADLYTGITSLDTVDDLNTVVAIPTPPETTTSCFGTGKCARKLFRKQAYRYHFRSRVNAHKNKNNFA